MNMNYDKDIEFYFYSKSDDKPFPGKGTKEKIPESKRADYEELSKIPQWRKKLSNFWLAEFDLDGHKWASVEHYYQGSKFRKQNPEFYVKFSLDSGSELSKDPNMAKSAGGKTGKVAGKQFRDKNIKVDDDFFTTDRVNQEMNDAQYAKFNQNPDLKTMLLATKDAKLMHIVSRNPVPVFFENLVNMRNTFKQK